eukprot:Gb_25272 [translate_table: standard]
MGTTELTPPFPFSSSVSHRNTNHEHIQISLFVQVDGTPPLVAKGQSTKIPKLKPKDNNMYASVLQECTNMTTLKQAHTHMLRTELNPNIFLATKLVWYVRKGFWEEALTLYYQMQGTGVQPDNYTFPFVLKVCAEQSALQEGKEIHKYIVRTRYEANVFVATALINMYTKCGSIDDARQVFDKMSDRDTVSWSAMISGYAQNERSNEALTVFHRMQLEDMKPDLGAVVGALQACAHIGVLQQGNHVCKVLDKMPRRDLVSWNAMIAGYAQNGYANQALTLFHQMQIAGIKPNVSTIVSVLPVCAHLGALRQGKLIHSYVIQSGFESDVSVGNSLVAMYVKCGSAHNGDADEALILFHQLQLADVKPNSFTMVSVLPACAFLGALQQGKIDSARQLFDGMPEKDVVSWSAMIAGYGMNGHGKEALDLFLQMQQMGMKPNHVTFTCVLSACSHAGLVEEGWENFRCMSRDYCISPTVEHYACMVDLLGCTGHLDEAKDFIEKMPFEPSAGVWGTLLGACRIYCNLELGERVAKYLFQLQPENAGYYVLMSNIYAAAGRVHVFLVGDISHPQSKNIYEMLENLSGQMKEAGYIPETDFVLHDVEEEVKEHMLGSHSEKLAIAFGRINITPGTTIRIIKNLRICGDCHRSTKFISKIVMRETIVRDTNRFHHFKDGLCSCGDYW